MLCAVAILGAGLAPAAVAKLSVTGVDAGTTPLQVGAPADLAVTIRFGGRGEDVKNLKLKFPNGLLGNGAATPRCSVSKLVDDRCDVRSIIGSTRLVGRRRGADRLTTIKGEMVNVTPTSATVARLGFVMRSGPFMRKVLADVTIRDNSLNSTIHGIGRTRFYRGFRIHSIGFTLFGARPWFSGPFIVNPIVCGPATATVWASSWRSPRSYDRASTSFVLTGCPGETGTAS